MFICICSLKMTNCSIILSKYSNNNPIKNEELFNNNNLDSNNDNNINNCEKYVQPGKYKCSSSNQQCRTCCHFDVTKLNENKYGDIYKSYYINQAVLIPQSKECLCIICSKRLEEFDNKPWF